MKKVTRRALRGHFHSPVVPAGHGNLRRIRDPSARRHEVRILRLRSQARFAQDDTALRNRVRNFRNSRLSNPPFMGGLKSASASATGTVARSRSFRARAAAWRTCARTCTAATRTTTTTEKPAPTPTPPPPRPATQPVGPGLPALETAFRERVLKRAVDLLATNPPLTGRE